MACSKAEDLINQLIEATLKLLDFGLNIMDALRVQKLLTIRNQKIGLISDDACLPECSLRFSLNFDLMMFNKLLRNACLRARATLNELRVCRLRYPNAPLVLEPKTKLKFQKLQKKIQDFDEAVKSDKMIARRDLRDFREISIIFSQLEHDLKLLICSLECASTMKDTVLFAAPITDVMTVLSIVLSRLERLAQKAEIDEKIAAAEQQKALKEQKQVGTPQSNLTTPSRPVESTPTGEKSRSADPLTRGKNTNRTSKQRREEMTALIAAAAAPSRESEEKIIDQTLERSSSMNFNINEHASRQHRSIRTNVRRHSQRDGRAMDILVDEISSNHHRTINRREMKQFRNEFVRKWANDARLNCAQQSRKYSIQRISSSEEEEISKKNPIKQHRNTSSNNSATVYLQPSKSNEQIECQIS